MSVKEWAEWRAKNPIRITPGKPTDDYVFVVAKIDTCLTLIDGSLNRWWCEYDGPKPPNMPICQWIDGSFFSDSYWEDHECDGVILDRYGPYGLSYMDGVHRGLNWWDEYVWNDLDYYGHGNGVYRVKLDFDPNDGFAYIQPENIHPIMPLPDGTEWLRG